VTYEEVPASRRHRILPHQLRKSSQPDSEFIIRDILGEEINENQNGSVHRAGRRDRAIDRKRVADFHQPGNHMTRRLSHCGKHAVRRCKLVINGLEYAMGMVKDDWMGGG
jgi:hypothetical protein